MYKSQLRIELLSDLCVADGNGYNSSVDIDVCQDEYGLPYIPAKRLKGCLRECAQELRDWGEKIPIEVLFGEEGDRRGACFIRNAYLEKREEYLSEILKGSEYALCHPQNILRYFTYIRNQTAIDYELGIAQEKSLRSVRVVKKGFIFIADVEWDNRDTMEHNWSYLQDCCAVLKHMGLSRTRGFGNVKISMEEKNQTNEISQSPYIKGATCLTYEIVLKEAIVCKSVNGQEQNSMDYIEGAKILGLIANRINQSGQDFTDFIKKGGGDLKCSNAYLQKSEIRLREVPASFYGIKNNSCDYCDKIYEKSNPSEKDSQLDLIQHSDRIIEKGQTEQEGKQLNPMKHSYVMVDQDGGLRKYHVAMEERYHHKRPDDKSIGRADESNDSVFYQISSICAGQKFQGFIVGSEQQIKQIYNMFTAENEIQLGYGKTSEYGRCKFQIISMDRKTERKEKGNEFWIQLVSPAILYNNRAFYSTSLEDLKEELKVTLGIEEYNIENMRSFVNLTTIGGYNVTWKMRKPTIEAFDKGTVIHIILKKEVEIPVQTTWIGERNAEGYGEIYIQKVKKNGIFLQKGKLKGEKKGTKHEALNLKDKPFLMKIARNLFQNYLAYQAACDVANGKWSDEIKPTVQNMILMCQDAKTIKDIQEMLNSRYDKVSEYKKKKREAADRILKYVQKKAKELETDFQEQQNLKWFSYQEDVESVDVELEYLRYYLIQIRYNLREKSVTDKLVEERKKE